MDKPVRCGVVIYDERQRRVRTCGQAADHTIIVRGDYLFATCARHNRRLERAFPELKES
jgi:hypothetical protein